MEHNTSRRSLIFYYFFGSISLIAIILLFPNFDFKKTNDLIFFITSLAFAFSLLLYPEISRVYEKYEIDRNGIAIKRGILRKKVKMLPFSQINVVDVKKGILGRLLNFGDLEISSVKGKIIMKGIVDPKELYDFIKHKAKGGLAEIKEKEEERKEESYAVFKMFE